MGLLILLQAIKNARERDRRTLLRAVSSWMNALETNIMVYFCWVEFALEFVCS